MALIRQEAPVNIGCQMMESGSVALGSESTNASSYHSSGKPLEVPQSRLYSNRVWDVGIKDLLSHVKRCALFPDALVQRSLAA